MRIFYYTLVWFVFGTMIQIDKEIGVEKLFHWLSKPIHVHISTTSLLIIVYPTHTLGRTQIYRDNRITKKMFEIFSK